MKNIKQPMLFILWASWSFAIPTLSQAEVIDRIVAQVGNEIILWSDLQQARQNVSAQPNVDPNIKRDLSDAALLDQLINQEFINQEMEKRGMLPKDSDVEAAISSVIADNNLKTIDDLELALRNEGVGMAEYRATMKAQIKESRMMNWLVKPRMKEVSDEDVARVVKQKYPDGKQVQLYQTYLLFVSKDTSPDTINKRWRKQIKDVETFKRLAQKHTEGPAKAQGGDLGYVNIENLQNEYARELRTLAPNQVSELIETERGYALLMYSDQKNEKQAVDPAFEADIRNELTRINRAQAFDQLVRDLRSKYHLDIKL